MRKHITLGMSVALLAALATACSTDTSGSDTTTDSADGTSALNGAEFTVAVQSAWPPIGFLDGEDLTGVAIDMANEISERHDVTFTFEKPAFADLIPGVQAGRYDFGFWGADITAERIEIVDQVSWLKSGYYLQTPADSGVSLGADLDGICGLRVSLVNGQTTQKLLEEASAECVAAGESEVGILTFPDQSGAELAVLSGRADISTVGSQTFAYSEVERPGEWTQVSDLLNPIYNGMVFQKDSELAQPIADAINELIADGTYQEILEKWNVDDSAITEAVINPDPAVEINE